MNEKSFVFHIWLSERIQRQSILFNSSPYLFYSCLQLNQWNHEVRKNAIFCWFLGRCSLSIKAAGFDPLFKSFKDKT